MIGFAVLTHSSIRACDSVHIQKLSYQFEAFEPGSLDPLATK